MTRSRASSTAPCDAASISMTSSARPSRMEVQAAQRVAGLAIGPERGAVDRLGEDPGGGGLAGPPRADEEVGVAPADRRSTAWRSVVTMGSWPMSSPNRWARNFRYRARCALGRGSPGSATGVGWAADIRRLPYTDSPRRIGGDESVVHPVSTTSLLALATVPGSSQVVPRHPKAIAYRCFLPDLTGFTDQRCAGPDSQRRAR